MPLGLRVQLNDEPPIEAGDDAISVLTAIVSYVASRQELEVRVGGMFARGSSGNEHADWLQRDLRIGDRIVVTVTDSTAFDPPVRRTRDDPEAAERAQRQYYEQLKARFEGS
jgi:hypothetical protein